MSISDIDVNTPTANDNAGLGDDEIRGLKSDVYVCFPAVNAVISNTGASGGAADTDPPDAATFSSLFARVKSLEASTGDGATIQPGMCMAWNLAVGAIPAGWTLCNGININNVPAPDLVDRFIVGAGNLYNNGEVVGSAPGTGTTGAGGDHTHTTGTHALSMAELPSALKTAITVQVSTGQSSIQHQLDTMCAGGETSSNARATPMDVTGPADSAHSHGVTGASGTHTHTLGANSLPPSQALTWICYVGVAP